ncbi:unnamed protein product [Fusarium graminearum]|nr:unnamed protein product [Fusarium graminearum]
MAPITCKVVDSFYRGIPRVLASLRCKDQHGRLVSTFESYTDSDGGIQYWLRAPFSNNAKAESVDITDTPFITLSFRLPPSITRSDVPWTKIENDLHLLPEYCHGVVLHLFNHSASYRLEHTRKPAVGPFERGTEKCEFDLMDCDTTLLRTPSPLQLPLPAFGSI